MRRLSILLIAGISAGIAFADEGAPTKDQAVSLVKSAVALIKDQGAQKAYPEINNRSGKFVSRDLYVEVVDMNGVVLANGGDVSLVGSDQSQTKDLDGKPFMRQRIESAASQPTFWQDYQYVNPVSKDVQPKHAYCERLTDTIVCGGVYTPLEPPGGC